MNNGKLFNFCLYKDTLKRLRIPGFVFLILVSFPVFFEGIWGTQHGLNYPISNLAVLSYVLIAPLMTIQLFGFMNKRNASDFYHAIPISRTCLFLTYISAIMTWISIILVISTALGFGCFAIKKQTTAPFDTTIQYALPIATKHSLLFLLAMLVCSLLVIGVIVTGMSLAGTFAMGFAISAMLLLLPGIFITYCNYYISLTAPFLNPKYFFLPFSNESPNLVSDSLISYFAFQGYNITDFCEMDKILSTFVLAILALCTGGYAFHKRNSAGAGFYTIHPLVESISRCFCCLAVTLIPLSLILTKTLPNKDYIQVRDTIWHTGKPVLITIIWYLIAIFIYFLFEYINSRKIKNLLKSIPGLFIVTVLNLAIYGIISGVSTYGANFTPAAEEIEYITIDFSSSTSAYNGAFANSLAADLKITDSAICKLVADSLVKMKQDPLDVYNHSNSILTFGICVDGTVRYRNVLLTTGQATRIYSYLNMETDFIDRYFTIPSENITNIYLSEFERINISDAETEKIYQYFVEEYNKLSFYSKKSIIENEQAELGEFLSFELSSEGKNSCVFELHVYFKYNGKDYHCLLPICSITSKAYNQVLSILSAYTMSYLKDSNSFANEFPQYVTIRGKDLMPIRTIDANSDEYDTLITLVTKATETPTLQDEYYLLYSYKWGFNGIIKPTEALKDFLEENAHTIE